MIHVCFGLHDKTGRYSKFTGTAMLSLFDNTTSEVTVHILHDNTLTQDNREKFIYLAGRYNQLVKFYNVEELCADKIAEVEKIFPRIIKNHFSIAALYRMFIPELLTLEKAIYLDSDIIVNLDITELWRIELGDKVLGVVPEIFNKVNAPVAFNLVADGFVRAEDYFNSGVLLMNLTALRGATETIKVGMKFINEHPEYSTYSDQEVLNYCFAKKSVKLPVKFNILVKNWRFIDAKIKQAIYHYAGGAGALNLKINDPFNCLWLDYFMKTPFFDSRAIGRLYDGFRQIHVELKNSLAKISALMSGKTRAFFTLPHNVEATKEIFSVRDDEDIILAENQDSLQKLIDAMKLSQGKKVFFILFPNFPFAALTQAGFVYGKDFLNGLDFLSEANGVPLDSYPLIQAM